MHSFFSTLSYLALSALVVGLMYEEGKSKREYYDQLLAAAAAKAATAEQVNAAGAAAEVDVPAAPDPQAIILSVNSTSTFQPNYLPLIEKPAYQTCDDIDDLRIIKQITSFIGPMLRCERVFYRYDAEQPGRGVPIVDELVLATFPGVQFTASFVADLSAPTRHSWSWKLVASEGVLPEDWFIDDDPVLSNPAFGVDWNPLSNPKLSAQVYRKIRTPYDSLIIRDSALPTVALTADGEAAYYPDGSIKRMDFSYHSVKAESPFTVSPPAMTALQACEQTSTLPPAIAIQSVYGNSLSCTRELQLPPTGLSISDLGANAPDSDHVFRQSVTIKWPGFEFKNYYRSHQTNVSIGAWSIAAASPSPLSANWFAEHRANMIGADFDWDKYDNTEPDDAGVISFTIPPNQYNGSVQIVGDQYGGIEEIRVAPLSPLKPYGAGDNETLSP